MNTLEILKAARAKIEKPENWHKGSFSADIIGRELDDPFHPDAVCWCARGALDVAFGTGVFEFDPLYYTLKRVLPRHKAWCSVDPVADFNDHPDTTHADIIALFDRAIAEYAKAVQS